jgi:hypothetical protein
VPAAPAGVGAAQAHRVELADIVRAHGAAYQHTHPLCRAQRRALRAIAECRSAALGGHRPAALRPRSASPRRRSRRHRRPPHLGPNPSPSTSTSTASSRAAPSRRMTLVGSPARPPGTPHEPRRPPRQTAASSRPSGCAPPCALALVAVYPRPASCRGPPSRALPPSPIDGDGTLRTPSPARVCSASRAAPTIESPYVMHPRGLVQLVLSAMRGAQRIKA